MDKVVPVVREVAPVVTITPPTVAELALFTVSEPAWIPPLLVMVPPPVVVRVRGAVAPVPSTNEPRERLAPLAPVSATVPLPVRITSPGIFIPVAAPLTVRLKPEDGTDGFPIVMVLPAARVTVRPPNEFALFPPAKTRSPAPRLMERVWLPEELPMPARMERSPPPMVMVRLPVSNRGPGPLMVTGSPVEVIFPSS